MFLMADGSLYTLAALIGQMLYNQVRYAETARVFYKLRGRTSNRVSTGLVQELGYAKYGTQFYAVKKLLMEEEILGSNGKFVENAPNVWLAELPQVVGKKERGVLGDEVPFKVFLASVLGSSRLGDLSKALALSRSSVYHAASRLYKAGLLQRNGTEIAPSGSAQAWLSGYLDACKTHVNVTGDISVLFRAVPAYIEGPRAYFALHHEVGRPIGRADMVIATWTPYLGFWESVVNRVRYFVEYRKDVKVLVANPSARVVWVDRLPFNAKARLPR